MGTHVTAIDNSELQQLVIGLATQIYFASRDGKDPDDPEVTRAIDLGRRPRRTTADQRMLEDATAQVGRRAYSALSYMIKLFCDFALYAEQASPVIDVPEFLRRAGLRAAATD